MDKEKRIKKEIRRLKNIFKDIPENAYKSTTKLIENVAFMTVTLDDLMDIVNKESLVVETKNASQIFLKENPALTAYNKMYSNFVKGLQQLLSLLPQQNQDDGNDNKGNPEDELTAYLKKKK